MIGRVGFCHSIILIALCNKYLKRCSPILYGTSLWWLSPLKFTSILFSCSPICQLLEYLPWDFSYCSCLCIYLDVFLISFPLVDSTHQVLIRRSLVHLELIFLCVCRVRSTDLISFFYMWTSNFLSTIYWRTCFYLNVYWHFYQN